MRDFTMSKEFLSWCKCVKLHPLSINTQIEYLQLKSDTDMAFSRIKIRGNIEVAR